MMKNQQSAYVHFSLLLLFTRTKRKKQNVTGKLIPLALDEKLNGFSVFKHRTIRISHLHCSLLMLCSYIVYLSLIGFHYSNTN